MATLWLKFLACSGLIVLCGVNLSRYGDVIAEKTGLGRAWIGLILIGIAAISLLAGKNLPALGPVGLSTPLVVGVYAFGRRSLFLCEK